MPKSNNKKKETKAQIKERELREEYNRVRRNLKRNVKSLENRGYDTSAITIPERPTGKIGKREINEIVRLDNKRYKLATKEVIVPKKVNGEWDLVPEKVTGRRARRFERKISSQKATATRREKERNRDRAISKKVSEKSPTNSKSAKDELNRLYENGYTKPDDYYESSTDYYVDDFDEDYGFPSDAEYEPVKSEPVYDASTDTVFDPATGEVFESSDLDFEKNVYFANAETGEIIERPYGARRPKDGNTYYRIMPPEYNAKMAYEKAMQELEIMANYQGDSKHGKNAKHDGVVRYNAQAIKEAIERMHDEFPSNVENAIYVSNYMSDYHSVEFMYRNGGYERYVSTFAQLAKVLGLDIIGEMDEDYDEGNYDY